MSKGVITPPGVYSRQVLMRQQARSYRPSAENADGWDEVAPEVQETVLMIGPMHIRTVKEMMGALGTLALYAHRQKLPGNREIWLA